MAHTITLIPGDGIGPEVSSAVVRIIEATGVEINWETHYAGAQALEKFGSTLPDDLLESIKRNKVALKGPDHDAGRQGLHVGQRRAAQDARPLRQRAPRARAAERAGALPGARPRRRAREHRRPLLGHRARRRPRRRRVHQDHHREGFDAHRPLRLRVRAARGAQEGDGRPQGQHHEALGRPLPRLLPQRRRRTTPRSRPTTRSSTTPACSSSCAPSSSTSCCWRTSTATSSPTSAPGSSAASGSSPARTSASWARSSRPSTARPPTSPGRASPTRPRSCMSGILMLRHLGEREAADRVEKAMLKVYTDGQGAHARHRRHRAHRRVRTRRRRGDGVSRRQEKS